MFRIDGKNDIYLTRGDDCAFTLQIENADGSVYDIGAQDTVTLSVKKSASDAAPVLEKTVTGSGEFTLVPADTAALSFGDYLYDVRATLSDGKVNTVIGSDGALTPRLHLLEEVGS